MRCRLARLTVRAAGVGTVIIRPTARACDRRHEPKQAPANKARSPATAQSQPAEDGVLAALTPRNVFVRNGQSAVVRVPTGLALIVPLKSGLETGRLRVYVSKSGDLRQDASLLTDETGV